MMMHQYALSDLTYLTEDIVLLHFFPKPDSPLLAYASGQYIEVLTERGPFPLSIANTPAQEGETHEITVHLRIGPQHPVADIVLKQIKQDGFIKFTGPKGHCIAKEADAYYFIAGGTGFSPIQALLTDILPTGKRCVLYWGIREPKDLYQQKLIEDWQKHSSHFEYMPVLSQINSTWPGKTGWVHEVFFNDQSTILNNYEKLNQTYYVYASGPYPMIQALKNGFIAHHLKLENLLSDMLPLIKT